MRQQHCGRRHPTFGRDEPRPRWQMCCIYSTGIIILGCLVIWTLRDATPVRFVEPTIENDLTSVDAKHLDDVYWRVSVRHVASTLERVCYDNDYTVLTNRNVLLDEKPMLEKYVFFCDPKMQVRSALNVRAVITGAAKKSVLCSELYAGIEKKVRRYYPFSLKYVSGQTFTAKTRVVRDARETCMWQHAISIVDGSWFSTI